MQVRSEHFVFVSLQHVPCWQRTQGEVHVKVHSTMMPMPEIMGSHRA